MGRNNFSTGLVIIIAGIALLLGKFGFFSFIGGIFWPFFLLIPGVLLHLLYFGGTLPSAVLIPGGILSVYALMFIFCNLFGWGSMTYLWPGFILGVAVGLYEYYFFDRHNPRGALIAASILAVIAAVMFGFTLLFTAGIYFISVLLIVLGVLIMARRSNSW